ncbi:MAG: CDP-alcohol phosphatidyltransferase family protein [Lachnospiraceae bacterium]|nr:CDP-alcohol phosphatidyltransferase family protein [Lachnospiraceae bacterium]
MRGEPKKEDLFKIPNILCYIRILLIPLFIIVFLNEYYWQSALIVMAASATDVIDGWIARHFNMVTDWGKFIDPLADKLMQLAMLVMAIFKNQWVLILIGVFLLKEVIMLIVGLYIYHRGANLAGAMWCGKLSTVVLDLSLLLIIGLPAHMIVDKFVFTLIGIASACLILSFIVYMQAYKKLFRELKEDGSYRTKEDWAVIKEAKKEAKEAKKAAKLEEKQN